jgi:hypothetical protein
MCASGVKVRIFGRLADAANEHRLKTEKPVVEVIPDPDTELAALDVE